MASPIVLQDDFSGGMKQDYPRDDMPRNCVWVAADFLPTRDAKLRSRFGWAYASNSITAVKATASKGDAGIYAPFAAAAKNLVVDEDGELYSVATNLTVTDIGASVVMSQNPVFHRDKAIFPAAGGATAPKYYDGSTLGNLAGSPPTATYATVWNDYTVLARTSANTNRLWFSPAGNPAGTWDTTNSWWDFTYPITGLAALGNTLLVFHDGYASRLIGQVPPPGGDLTAKDPSWSVGCPDAFSIAYWRDHVIFANGTGVYITDGAGISDLTAMCGQKSYWLDKMATYTGKSDRLAAGIYNDRLFLTHTNAIGTANTHVVHLNEHSWWKFANVDARCYWPKEGANDELYWGQHGAARVATTSTMFTYGSATLDGDGDVIASTLETPYYRGGVGSKGFRRLYVLDFLSGTAPTVAVSYSKEPFRDPSYTALASFAKNTTEQYRSMAMGFGAQGISLKLVRALEGDWRLNGIAADVHARERSRA